MRESFLHFIWQFQKFDSSRLQTAAGQIIKIFSLGQYNTDAGPDFLNAKILLHDITWYGNVEIHLKSSDWDRHAHQHDEAYNNVILHVVWEHDVPVYSADGRELPVVELKDRVSPQLLTRCNELLKSPETIPCQSLIHKVKSIDVMSMLEKSGIQRLENKSDLILQMLEKNQGSWEETAYQLLARNFGFKTNAEPFGKLSVNLPHKILIKYANHPIKLESLVFGMAGFLEQNSPDKHVQLLNREFTFLAKKHGLKDKSLLKVEWKFMRMRPGNFPTVRLAQFVTFVQSNAKFFQDMINFSELKDLESRFKCKPGEYWVEHYDFGKKSSKPQNGMGQASVTVLLINTVAPLLAAYGRQTKNDHYMSKAVDLLMALKPERNTIIDEWKTMGIKAKNALDSQALIGLRNDFCLKNQCLSCKIGVSLINR